MWESIHALTNLDVNISVLGDFCLKIVLVDDVVSNISNFDPHVFISFHCCAEIEILDVDSYVSGPSCGDDTIAENFDSEEVDHGCAAVEERMDSVSAYGESSSIWILLFGSVVYTDVSVRDVLPSVCWDICLVDEKQCIRARYTARDALRQSSEFVAVRFYP